MQALTIQEKEIEVQRTNIELERKSLQLNTYQQIDDQFENATDAAELSLAGLKSNKDHFLHNKEEVKMKSEFPKTTPGNVSPETTPKNIDVIEAPPMPVEYELKTNVVKGIWPHMSEMKPYEGMNSKSQMNHTPRNSSQQMWSPPWRLRNEVGLCFYGKDAAEYPAYRHRLLLNYRDLRNTRLDMLLHWIESTIEGQAKQYVQNAFTVMDPGEASDVIWNTLEEIYGRKDVILEHAMQQVKRRSRSIGHNRQILLEFRAAMRKLKGVASSIGKTSTLDGPMLLGQLYSAFNEKLRSRFDSQYPANRWTFEQFLLFLSAEIDYVDSLHLMKVDIHESSCGRAEPSKKKSHAASTSRWHSKPFIAALERTPKLHEDKSVVNMKTCLIHPETRSHDLVECQVFLNMTVDELWKFAKEQCLCFLCLKRSHTTKFCKNKLKQRCKDCASPHHVLLHKPVVRKKASTGEAPSKPTAKEKLSEPNLPLKVLGYVKENPPNLDQVCVMKMTALPSEAEAEFVTFFSAIDTGATSTLCSRTLAERLWGFWEPNCIQEYKLFDGSSMHCEVMNEDLVLQKSDGRTAMFENMTFINCQLPFSEYLPADESGHTPNVDMIVGGDLAWKHILCSKSLTWQGNRKVASHELGTLWLRTNNESHCHLDVHTLSGSQRLTPKSAVCSKVRLASSDRHDDVVKLENNILYRSTNDNKVAMSMEDEKVLKNFKETVKLVKVDNDDEPFRTRL